MINLSVKNLIDLTCFSGDLDLESSDSSRALEGILIHQKIQEKRSKEYLDYKKEVHFSKEFQALGYDYTITGRLDGMFTDTDTDLMVIEPEKKLLVIEEIKSIQKKEYDNNWEKYEKGVFKHWAQGMLYGALYFSDDQSENVGNEIIIRLTYAQAGGIKAQSIEKKYKKDELLDFLNGLLVKRSMQLKKMASHAIKRRRFLKTLKFPFDKFRDGQRRLSAMVYSCIRAKEKLMFSAPTGTGKTMAAVFPALKAMGELRTDRIFYATARTSCAEMAEDALAMINREDGCIRTITITAKARICPFTDCACNPEECSRAKGHFDRLEPALNEAWKLTDLSLEVLRSIADKHEVCPFEFSLDVSLFCDVIICDYNYIFDPRVYLRRFFDDNMSKDSTLLVDEAHNLVSRGRDMYSAEVFKDSLLSVKKRIKDKNKAVFNALEGINKEFNALIKEGIPYIDIDVPERFLKRIKKFCEVCDEQDLGFLKTRHPGLNDDFMDLYFSMITFNRIYEFFNESHRFLIEDDNGSGVKASLFCMDPTEFIKERTQRVKSSIFFSATLEPDCFYAPIFGLDKASPIEKGASPFPRQNMQVIVQSSHSMRYGDRDNALPHLGMAVVNLIRSKKGNYLIFLPSFAYLEKLQTILEKVLADKSIILLAQERSMTIAKRQDFLDHFRQENRTESLVGLAVMGGLFGEGIDLKGEHLSGALIAGPGIPGVCLRRDLIREHFDEIRKQGFEFAYLYPGMNRVLQAAGRVIRTETDRGVVILFDSRFSQRNYKRHFPKWWNCIEARSAEGVQRALSAFWSRSI